MSLPTNNPLQVEWGVHKNRNTMNYHFQNINGLKWSPENFPLTVESIKNMALHQFNIISLVETNTEWELDWKRPFKMFKNLLRKTYSNVSICTSASNTKFHTEYKPGWTATIISDPWHAKVLEKATDHPLGRLSYITVQVKGNKKLTFMTVYRVCAQASSTLALNNRIGAQNTRTCYSQQLEVYAQQGIIDIDPRHATVEDLKTLILKKFYSTNNYLLIGMDANEANDKRQSSSMFDTMNSLGLHDALQHLNGEGRPPTIASGSHTIDYIFASQNLLPHIVGAGQLRRDTTFASDHPALFVQLNSDSLLNNCNTSNMPPPRKLRTIDIAVTETYLEELRNQFAHNDIKNRVKTLFEVPVTEWNKNHTTRFNSLDMHITAIMLSAEKKCSKKYHGKYEWSRPGCSWIRTCLLAHAEAKPPENSE